ncbi:MAG: hypothetical protein OEY89_09005 [Gammaproteobacteria bacterium]|nr:hypothetical protein [Gammaproteobacteria bacterium]
MSYDQFIHISVYLFLPITIIGSYLTTNRIWVRKHKLDVADSISLPGKLIGLIPIVFMTVHFVLVQEWAGLLNNFMYIVIMAIQVLVGMGIWVRTPGANTIWKKVKRSLKMESTEISHLARDIIHLRDSHVVIDLLVLMANSDDKPMKSPESQ